MKPANPADRPDCSPRAGVLRPTRRRFRASGACAGESFGPGVVPIVAPIVALVVALPGLACTPADARRSPAIETGAVRLGDEPLSAHRSCGVPAHAGGSLPSSGTKPVVAELTLVDSRQKEGGRE